MFCKWKGRGRGSVCEQESSIKVIAIGRMSQVDEAMLMKRNNQSHNKHSLNHTYTQSQSITVQVLIMSP